MCQLLKKLLLSLVIFGAFCVAGYLASSIEYIHNSIVASSAIFGVSFVSIIGWVMKIWSEVFG